MATKAKRTMEARPQLEIELDERGTITLTQEASMGETQSIYLDPDQVLPVIQWLQELLEKHHAQMTESN